MITDPTFRLVERPGNAVLFYCGETAIDAATFLRHCHALAATLPAHGYMINQCRDRYAFAVSFAASVLRGTPCLLTGDRSAAGLGMLAETYKDSYIVTDEAGATRDAAATAGLPVHVIDTRPGGSGAQQSDNPPNPVIPTDQLAAIVFTSGSTGAPTPHCKSWGALAERSRAAATQFGLIMTDPVAVVGTVPPQHMYGFETTVPAAAACAGRKLVWGGVLSHRCPGCARGGASTAGAGHHAAADGWAAPRGCQIARAPCGHLGDSTAGG